MADIYITVYSDKTASIDRSYFAIQGEQVVVNLVVDSTIAAMAYDGYLDFLTQDGQAVWRGPLDVSSEEVEFTLESDDDILQVDGVLLWQFVMAETNEDDTRDIKWLAKTYKSRILSSISALQE